MAVTFLKLHIAILLAGFTAILGKLILLPEGPLVWWRMGITSLLLSAWLCFRKELPGTSLAAALRICGIGALISVHWLFFYGSIKYANVSIAVVCFALTGFFTAVIEPILGRRAPSLRELAFSTCTVVGIALIFHFDSQYRTGIVLGVLSALFATLFTIAIRHEGKHHASTTMLLFQMIGGFLFLSLAAPAYLFLFPASSLVPTLSDTGYLLVLSSVCTIGLFLLQIQALRHISAFTVNLSFNLEPVYSIAMAMVFLGEAAELSVHFFVGLSLISLSVVLQTLYTVRQR